MPVLTNEQKVFVVSGFARFEGVAEVCRSFKDEYGLDLSKPHALAYNPSGANYRGAQKWRDLFERERKTFLDNVSAIGIANKSFRLQSLHKLCAIAMERKNIKLAAEIMEQAAKEMGEVFTNRREVKSENKSITAHMTTDELRNEIINDLGKLGVDAAGLAVPGVGSRDKTQH
jgi:hypothetical protein